MEHKRWCSLPTLISNISKSSRSELSKHSDYSPTVLRHLGLIINFVAQKSGGANAADSR